VLPLHHPRPTELTIPGHQPRNVTGPRASVTVNSAMGSLIKKRRKRMRKKKHKKLLKKTRWQRRQQGR
jgi:hypothetical protein